MAVPGDFSAEHVSSEIDEREKNTASMLLVIDERGRARAIDEREGRAEGDSGALWLPGTEAAILNGGDTGVLVPSRALRLRSDAGGAVPSSGNMSNDEGASSLEPMVEGIPSPGKS